VPIRRLFSLSLIWLFFLAGLSAAENTEAPPRAQLPSAQTQSAPKAVPVPELSGKVFLSGEVGRPGEYRLQKGEKLSSVLERAGGYTEKAYLRGAVLIRNSAKISGQKLLEDLITKLNDGLLLSGSAAAPEEKASFEYGRRFIESLRALKASGRIPVTLSHLRLLKGSDQDIELEDGDSLYIPVKTDSIKVAGAVISSGLYPYSDKYGYKDYIAAAGGYAKGADRDSTYVLKVDGTVYRLPKKFMNWNPVKSRWELSAFSEEKRKIEAGDTIVVPELLESMTWLKKVEDSADVLMRISAAGGGFIYSIKK